MALENYDLASLNLSAAARIDPTVMEIYDTYIELADVSKGPGYARAAVNLAKENRIESFLERMPAEPQLSLEEGSYDSHQEVTITAEEGTEIIVVERNDNSYDSYTYTGDPIRLLSGETEITAYCTKDGIPSDEVSATYKLQYEPTEIKFKDALIEANVREDLDKDSGPITDIDCEGITSLYCTFSYDMREKLGEDDHTIETLEDLDYFPKLAYLGFSGSMIKADLHELSKCRKLRSVNLSSCGIKDLSFVRDLPELSNIYLQNNEELTDISPLADCENLGTIAIDGTGITDLSPLYDKEIYNLEAELTDKINADAIGNWKDTLTSLTLYNCGGKDLSWIGECTKLGDLQLTAAKASNRYDEETEPLSGLEFLSKLSDLNYLYLYGLDDVSSLQPVKTLKKLTYISFWLNDRDAEVSEDVIADLKKSLPNCNISY